MKKYKTKTIIEIDSKEFEKQMDAFIDGLDGEVKDIILHTAPESKVAFVDDTGQKGEVFYNHYEGIILYRPAKHLTKKALKALIGKFNKYKKKINFRNRSK